MENTFVRVVSIIFALEGSFKLLLKFMTIQAEDMHIYSYMDKVYTSSIEEVSGEQVLRRIITCRHNDKYDMQETYVKPKFLKHRYIKDKAHISRKRA